MREAILKDLEKMKEANFIEPFISPFAAPRVVFEKVTVVFVSQLIFEWSIRTLLMMPILFIG